VAARILRRIRAAEDAESIAGYIAKQSPEAAVRFLLQAEATLEFLAEFPSLGERFPIDIPELADLRVSRVKGFPNHLIFYNDHPAAIEVVRILHGAMDIETELRKR
jgi:toxin ParE1/3/4